MSKRMKKHFALLLTAMLVISSCCVYGNTVYHLDENFNGDLTDGTPPSPLTTGKMDAPLLPNVSTYEGGLGGKTDDDKAFVITTTDYDGVGTSNDPNILLDAIDGSQFVTRTIEASAMNISGASTISIGTRFSFSGTGNSDVNVDVFRIRSDGTIITNGLSPNITLGTWEPNRWYSFAMTFKTNTKTADVYFNGKLIKANAAVSNLPANIKGVRRIKFNPAYSKNATVQSGAVAVDNMRLYDGVYEVSTPPQLTSESVRVDNTNKKIYIGSPIDSAEFLTAVQSSGSTYWVYDDAGLTSQVNAQTTVEPGMVLVAPSSDSRVLEYYDILAENTEYNVNYNFENAGEQLVVKATVNHTYYNGNAEEFTAVLAIYEKETGNLTDVIIKESSEEVPEISSLKVNFTSNPVDADRYYAKVILINNLSSIRPIIDFTKFDINN